MDPTEYLVNAGVPRHLALQLLADLDQRFVGQPRHVVEGKLQAMVADYLAQRFGDGPPRG